MAELIWLENFLHSQGILYEKTADINAVLFMGAVGEREVEEQRNLMV